MFKKFLLVTILVLMLVAGCSTTPVDNDNFVPQQDVQPSVGNENAAGSTNTVQGNNNIQPAALAASSGDTVVVSTGQTACYDNQQQIPCPEEGEAFYGQDGKYQGVAMAYQDNGDGTVTDLHTGLMWQQSPEINDDGTINAADKLSYNDALVYAESVNLAGYDDWRLPTIKELYSLIDFSGFDVSGYNGTDTDSLVPFINTAYFDFGYGDTGAGERIIDAQFATSTLYVSTTMGGAETMFGLNLADGRIKGYPTGAMPGQSEAKGYYVLYVRGNNGYGENDFVNNGNGTVTDNATGLTWTQADSGEGVGWEAALQYCEALDVSGYDDWRLPDIKELQSIVDYTRSPDTTASAAIDPVFDVTTITNEAGQADYPAFWSSTTHANMMNGSNAAYITFGRAMGYMNGSWIDVHGAGAQRSDPKSGDASQWPAGHGPQGDAIRIDNYVRCVRSENVSTTTGGFVDAASDSVPSAQTSDQQEQTAPNQEGPDLSAAAETLGISEEVLRSAMGDPVQGPPDLAVVAEILGISEQALMDALGPPPGQEQGPPPGG